MQSIFKCCHGVLEQPGLWICTPHPSTAGRLEEEVVRNDGPTSKAYAQAGDSLPLRYDLRPNPPGRFSGEDETAKARLQRLIRDFAHDAVGPGLPVKVQIAADTNQDMLLRMDRRLSYIELWLPEVELGDGSTIAAPLQEVASISKGTGVAEGAGAAGQEALAGGPSSAGNTRDASMLTFTKKTGDSLRLIFETPIERDRAYTCLRIFQMSVDQTGVGDLEDAEDTA